MTTIYFPSSIVFGPPDQLKPVLGPSAAFRDSALKRVYLELNSNGLGDVINLVPLVQEIAALRPDVAVIVVTNQSKLPFRWCAPQVTTRPDTPSEEDRTGPGSLYFNLSRDVRYHLYAPHWLQFFAITGIGQYTYRGDPFPLLPERELREFDARLAATVGSQRGFILLHQENTRIEWEGRNTDPENLRVIARALAQQGFRILEIGNDNPSGGEFTHLGKLTLEELTWAMKRCDGFVGIDSFPMHVAALYNKPLLGFFAATHPEVVLPPASRITVLRNEAIPCNGCVYITRPRDYNRCVLGHLECAHRLPDAYLLKRLERFVESMTDAGSMPDAQALEHSWRMAQQLLEQSVLLDRLRGRHWIPEDLRQRIAASVSSELD
jgi:ADP-heptose:LPS heptosyltransferase